MSLPSCFTPPPLPVLGYKSIFILILATYSLSLVGTRKPSPLSATVVVILAIFSFTRHIHYCGLFFLSLALSLSFTLSLAPLGGTRITKCAWEPQFHNIHSVCCWLFRRRTPGGEEGGRDGERGESFVVSIFYARSFAQ